MMMPYPQQGQTSRPEILQTAALRLREDLLINLGPNALTQAMLGKPIRLSGGEAEAAVDVVVASLAVEGGLSLTELDRLRDALAQVTAERDRLQAEARATRRLRAALRDLVADARERDEELLKLRDRTPDHKKSLGIERAAHEVRVLANSLDRILGVDGADDSHAIVAKADLVAYLNRGTADLATEADALNRLLAAAGLDAGQQDGDGR